jgi:4-alpha-glucanotransferase
VTAARPKSAVSELARLCGIEPSYVDGLGRRRRPRTETLIAVLRALGAPVRSPADVPDALRERAQALASCVIEPMLVAWDGELSLNLGRCDRSRRIECTLDLEDGTTREWRVATADAAERVSVEWPLPAGYHRLCVDDGKAIYESLIISAPVKAYAPPTTVREWGVFAPLYAVHSSRSWGAGDFGDLRELLEWARSLAGTTVATLPLLAAYTLRPPSISPYSPASRLFWNEMYIDVGAVPELAQSGAAIELIASPGFQAEIEALRRAPLVDYEGVTALKRRPLELLAESLAGSRRDAFESYLAETPRLAEYSRFRAAGERAGCGWHDWPERMRGGVLEDGDYDSAVARYHAYVQWIADEQLQSLSGGVAFDLPLGVHGESYDTWRFGESFASGVTAGAPPDAVFTGGQNWGFPPPHPQHAREAGCTYLVAALRHLMSHAAVLRVDHILGLHRLFWIPEGMDSSEGVYVRYPADELYAILVLESHRNKTVIVGEDLGNVPAYVRPAMARHGILGSYVLQYELASGCSPQPPNAGQVASLNTHDMQPFAAYWADPDNAGQRSALARAVPGARNGRAKDGPAPQRAANGWLAGSEARTVLVNLEDLWGETERQNVPGTSETERPNWRRRLRYSLEEMRAMPAVTDALAEVASARRADEVVT